MAFVVLYDACVLYPAPLRDLLMRLANTGVVRARWSDAIFDECFRNILENRPDLKPESLQRTRELMTQAVPDCMVTDFEGLIDALVLPERRRSPCARRRHPGWCAGDRHFQPRRLPDRPPGALQHRREAPRRLRDRHARFVTRRRGEGDRGSGRSSEKSATIGSGAAGHPSRPRSRAFRRQASRAVRPG